MSGRGALAPAPGNVAAPAIVTPPAGLVWDYSEAENGQKLQWPLTNNQFDAVTVKLNGETRDWAATFSGTTERYGGMRYYYAWTNILPQNTSAGLTTAYPHWQPAFREVFRVRRKGTSGADLRTLVFDCMHNTATIPVGDTVWCYLNGSYNGAVDPVRSVNIGGFNLPLFAKMRCSGSTASPDSPITSRSFVEVAFDQDLPAIDYTPPTYTAETWLPVLPRLWLVHHSFYANAATKTLRKPYDWHFGILKNDVVANNGHLVLGGYQGIPVWRDWGHLFNWMGGLAEELFAMEKQALADYWGGSDPRMVMDEFENEPVVQWKDAPGTDKPLGFRRALLEIMYPTSRAAWGPERTLLIKGTGYGGADGLRLHFDLDNDRDFGGANNMVGMHQYADQAHFPDNRIVWWGARSDCDYTAGILANARDAGKFKGAAMTEMGVSNTKAMPERAQHHGRMHTAMVAKGIPVAYWDWGGDHYAVSYLYRDVAGKEGKVVQALQADHRPYTGKSGRTV